MALILADRVRETSTTTGTGALSLAGAVVGYQTFSSAIGNTNTCYYAISNPGVAEWEVGIGTYATSGNTLTRTTILKSSNSNAAVSFSAGTKDVFVTYPATKSVYLDASGNVTLTGTLTANTIGAFTLSGTVAGGGNQLNNVIIGTTTPLAGAFTTLSATGALTGTSAAFTDVVTITKSGANARVDGLTVTNANAGTGTLASIRLSNGSGNDAALILGGTGYTSYGVLVPNAVGLYSSGTAGAFIASDNAAGHVKIGVGTSVPVVADFSSTGLAVTGTLTSTLDATIYGVTVGRGGGAISNSTAVGYQAGYNNTNGNFTAVGYRALYTNTTYASNNSAFGDSCLYLNTTGSSNTAVGALALYSNTTASNNTAVGYQAGYTNSTGTNNVFIGHQAGFATTGSSNTFVGKQSNGNGSGELVTTGSKNTILGGYNGNQGGLDIRTASNYVVLSDGDGNPRQIIDGSGYLFYYTMNNGAGTNALKYNTSTGAVTYDTSSARYKDNIRDSIYGLSHVMQMRSTQFEYKDNGRSDVGLIAEELNPIIPELVGKNKDGQPDSVSYDRMVSVLVKAIQELKAEFDTYKSTHP